MDDDTRPVRPEDYLDGNQERIVIPIQIKVQKSLLEAFDEAIRFFEIPGRSQFFRGQMKYLIDLKEKQERLQGRRKVHG